MGDDKDKKHDDDFTDDCADDNQDEELTGM
jgi:hypothetical protein